MEGHRPDAEGDDGVLLHCANSNGFIFEASTFGDARNSERDSSDIAGGGHGGSGGDGMVDGRGWHMCADLEASLLVRFAVSPPLARRCLCLMSSRPLFTATTAVLLLLS